MSADLEARSIQNVIYRLEVAIDASGIGIWEHNVTDGSIVWDKRLRALYGLGDEQPVTWIDLVHPEDQPEAAADFDRACVEGHGYSSQFRIVLPTGQIRHLRSKAHMHVNEHGHTIMIGAEWDISEDVLLHQQLVLQAKLLEESRHLAEHAAMHDYLTDLSNRRGMDEFFKTESAVRQGAVSAVLHIDLDHFKAINDSFGHLAGDEYLRRFAVGLVDLIPSNNLVARTGGDEFVIIMVSSTPDAACLLAEAIISQTKTLMAEFGGDFGSVSIGVSAGSDSWMQLLKNSDRALYHAKRKGRARYCLYDRYTPRYSSGLIV